VMPQLTLGAAGCFNSTNKSTESFIDGKSLADTVDTQTTKTTVPKQSRNAGERIQRSRERNRIHARKTRQRKKEQLQSLQNKAEQLKGIQVNLKLSINEKNTANILCCLFSNNQGLQSSSSDDPRVEALLTRPEEEIPDPSKLPALQPLILPSGAQHSKRNGDGDTTQLQQLPNDGIDYELLGKDRSQCTPAELDQIRRERNRMHAKRTRDRKRLFMEEMAEMCKILEGENRILQQHLDELNGIKSKSTTIASATKPIPTSISSVPTVSPFLSPAIAPASEPSHCRKESLHYPTDHVHQKPVLPLTSQNGASFDQMKTLLDAAGVFDLNSNAHGNRYKNMNMNSASSCAVSISSDDHTDYSTRPFKKRRKLNLGSSSSDEDGCD